jgi:hypothetical protein
MATALELVRHRHAAHAVSIGLQASADGLKVPRYPGAQLQQRKDPYLAGHTAQLLD